MYSSSFLFLHLTLPIHTTGCEKIDLESWKYIHFAPYPDGIFRSLYAYKTVIIICYIILFLSCFSFTQVGASIHEYKNEKFVHRSNSFFFHGGNEGLYASRVRVDTSNATSAEASPSLASLSSDLSQLSLEEQKSLLKKQMRCSRKLDWLKH